MSEHRYHLTLKSRNAKTGPIPVSTTSEDSCPPACPLGDGGGCYGELGPLRLHWDAVGDGARGGDLSELCTAVRAFAPDTLWRHNQVGDLAGVGDILDAEAVFALAEANRGRQGFTYTHYPMRPEDCRAYHDGRWSYDAAELVADGNKLIVQAALAAGFAVNLSANDRAHADDLYELQVAPVVTILPSTTRAATTSTPAGRKVLTCPAILRPGVNCAMCGICAVRLCARPIIGFPAHGTRRRIVDELVTAAEVSS